ncbi:MAG: IPT/TIG domain-containing protein [Nitrospira sp.]|nr:IPT/TIG domain-containing protein [Nitrospira sp.]
MDPITIPLRVTAPRQLVISSSTSLPDGKVGIGYSTTLTATGGTAPYTWQILRGALPPGLSLSSGGLISGIPTSSGSFSFRAQVLDGNLQQDQTTLTITVEGIPPAAPTLTTLAECNEETTPQIRLTWTASSGVDYYQVFRNGFAFSGVSDSSTTNSTTFLDTQVTLGISYTYSIVAINSGGKTRSNEVTETARCGVAPGAFTLSVVTLCRENAPVNRVDWTGASGRTQPYEIYRNNSLLAQRDLGGYDDTAVSGGTTYTYLMRARNSVGQRDSNAVGILTKSDCTAPVAPVITSITPQAVTIGTGDFTLTVNGQNFDATTRLLYAPAGNTPATPIFPTSVTSTTLTFRIVQTSSGFLTAFPYPGAFDIQVFKPVLNFYDGQRSGTTTFTVFNPAPVITSITGTCRANLNCTPGNGFDVRINGSGFVANSPIGSVESSTYIRINGRPANHFLIGQGPVATQMQLLANGLLIVTPGTYSLLACNDGTTAGTTCSTGDLTVVP